MKKGKFLSILTSMAMSSSMVLSAVPSMTASAASNPLGLQLTSAKTTFSLEEIQAGQSATVYVDPSGSFTENDHVGSVEFKLKSSAWGKVDPVDLFLCNPNVLETSKGSEPKSAYNSTGTMVISKWEGEKPKKVGYTLQDYNSVASFPGSYSDDYCPSVILISDSSKGFLKTGSEGQHIAEFKVNFPKDLAEGTYTISLTDAKSMICVDGEFGSNSSEMAVAPSAQAITFTIGNGSSQITTTPAPTPTPGPSGEVTMTENPVVKDADKVYDADATLKGDVVKAKAGEEVTVPVYLELGANADPKFITGIGFKLKYDTTALQLVEMKDGDGFISDGAYNGDEGTGVFLFTFTSEDIEIDPTKPIANLKFKVNAGAANGTYPVHITNHLNGDTSAVQIIHTQYAGQQATYFVPHVTDGAVVVGEGGVTPTPVPGTTNNADGERIYDGTATLKGETVKGTPGTEVKVPVYLELGTDVNPKYITGIGFKAVYDKSALELVDIKDGDGFISDGSFNGATETGVFLFTYTSEDIEIDPTKPIAYFTFKVNANATGTIPVKFICHLNDVLGDNANIQIVHTQLPQQQATYLKPTVINGAVQIDGGVIETSTTPAPGPIETTTNADNNRIYDGSANLRADTVKGNPGTEVKVPVYLELGPDVDPKYITGIGFKVVYDKSVLELVEIKDGDGFISDGSFNGATETGVFLFTYTSEDIEIDPTKPIAYFTFKIKDGAANGTYPVKLINHLTEVLGENAKIQIIHTQYPQKAATYLTPNVTDGAVIVGDIDNTTPAPVPGPIETTTTEYVPTPGPIETTTTEFVPTPGPIETTTTQYVPTPGPIETTTTQYVPTPGPIETTTTQYVPTPGPIETTTTPAPGPGPIETTTTPAPGPQTQVSISIVDNENHWYFADENSWNLDQVKVFVDGNPTTFAASELTFTAGSVTNALPSNTYQKGVFDYKITVSYKGATAEFTAKIGQRGDANCDHEVNVRDAAAIAKDLAFLIKNNNKSTLTNEGGFGIFLGNVDGAKSDKKPAYAPYDLNVRDAATIAKYLAFKSSKPGVTIKDYI